jgi:putative protease
MVKLIAPAGSFASLKAAIQGSADAVYFGIKGLNMRSGGKADFTLEELPEIIKIAHEAHIEAYLTLNTITYDEEKNNLIAIITSAKKAGVDAIIAWDFQVIELVKEQNIPIHISTQASISNFQALKFYANQGAAAAVLARELTLPQIKDIIKQRDKENLNIKIEAFIHGAMCVAVSGRCFMSQIAHCKSANRGECLQMCRRSYLLKDEEENTEFRLENNFVMSPKDLCAMPIIDHILDAKIDFLKIEGRMRSPEYVKVVVANYRKAIDLHKQGKLTEKSKEELIKRMEEVYNKGFSLGFYNGVPENEWAGIYGSKATTSKMKIGKVVNYYSKRGVAEIRLESSEINEGESFYIIGPTTGVIEGIILGMIMDTPVTKVKKGETFTMKSTLVRQGDDFFRIVKNEQ